MPSKVIFLVRSAKSHSAEISEIVWAHLSLQDLGGIYISAKVVDVIPGRWSSTQIQYVIPVMKTTTFQRNIGMLLEKGMQAS